MTYVWRDQYVHRGKYGPYISKSRKKYMTESEKETYEHTLKQLKEVRQHPDLKLTRSELWGMSSGAKAYKNYMHQHHKIIALKTRIKNLNDELNCRCIESLISGENPLCVTNKRLYFYNSKYAESGHRSRSYREKYNIIGKQCYVTFLRMVPTVGTFEFFLEGAAIGYLKYSDLKHLKRVSK